MKKKWFKRMGIVAVVASLLFVAACGGGNSTENYPTKSVNGVIQWGAGGAMDNVARAVSVIAEEHLGKSIVLTNRPGATGSIAAQFVNDKPADGYHLLFAAENPALYGVLDIADIGFEDFYPVNIFGRGLAAVVVPVDSKYQTLTDVIEDAKANPGTIKMGSTGPGGLPFMVTTMIESVAGVDFNMIPYDGEGPAITALLGNHIDVLVSGFTAAAENAKAGKLRVLAMVNDEPVEALPDAPAITEELPEIGKFLPWGPFYGVYVKKDTPDEVKEKLVDAFAKAQQSEQFQKFLEDMGMVSMGIHGEEAEQFWRDWQSTSAWLLEDAGEAKVSPEELGIPRK